MGNTVAYAKRECMNQDKCQSLYYLKHIHAVITQEIHTMPVDVVCIIQSFIGLCLYRSFGNGFEGVMLRCEMCLIQKSLVKTEFDNGNLDLFATHDVYVPFIVTWDDSVIVNLRSMTCATVTTKVSANVSRFIRHRISIRQKYLNSGKKGSSMEKSFFMISPNRVFYN